MAQIQHPARKLVLSLSAAALLLGGCADMNLSKTQRDSAIGAGVGAVAGAVIGGGAKGAVIRDAHPEVLAACKVSPTGRPDSAATGAARRP